MPGCREIDTLVTAYVDGEASLSDRARVDTHLAACPPCRERAAAESAARDIVRARRSAMTGACAPARLHARCAASQPRGAVGWLAAGWRSRVIPVAVAAAAILAVATAAFWVSGQSATVLAAQLTLDHVKCFEFVEEPSIVEPAQLEAKLAERYGWHLKVPPASSQQGLRLITARRCSYSKGKVAHLMYRHNDRPVSLFVLPGTRSWAHTVQVMEHEALIWSEGDNTFLLVGREPRAEVEQLAAYVRTCNK